MKQITIYELLPLLRKGYVVMDKMVPGGGMKQNQSQLVIRILGSRVPIVRR